MGIGIRIRDGEGTGREAGVTTDFALKVAQVQQSSADIPIEELTRFKEYRGFFELAGSNEMAVDGSTTPQTFSLQAETGRTRWISEIKLIIEGLNFEVDTTDMRRFGTATAVNTPLTNGVEMFLTQGGVQTNLLADPARTLGDLIKFGDSWDNFVNAAGSQEDIVIVRFMLRAEAVVAEGSIDEISVRINDDLTALDSFKALIAGRQEFI